MNKKQCRDALDLYKKFLIRMDRVGEFLKVAEVSYKYNLNTNIANIIKDKLNIFFSLQNVGIDKGDIPDLTKVRALKILFIISLSRYTVYDKGLFNYLYLIIGHHFEELLKMSEKNQLFNRQSNIFICFFLLHYWQVITSLIILTR